MASTKLTVNGKSVTVNVDDPKTPLLYFLSDDLRMNGPKFGCGLAQCGACTVLIDGNPTRSCVTPIQDVDGAILTIEGLGNTENPHPIQQAFIDEQAIQCGFCISGVMLYGKWFMDQNPKATAQEISEGMEGILCRCHTHVRMVRALQRYGEGLSQ